MNQPAAWWRNGRLNRLAGQLVAERQPIPSRPQQPALDALVGLIENWTGDPKQEIWIKYRGNQGRDVEESPRLG